MDLRMPVLDGVAATAEVLATLPKTRVLVLTTFDDDASIKRALAAGACGYLTKDASGAEVVAAVQAAAAGRTPLDARIAGRVVAGLPDAEPRSLRERFPDLTAREAEVLRLMAAGRTNPEIAAELGARGVDDQVPRERHLRQTRCRRSARGHRADNRRFLSAAGIALPP